MSALAPTILTFAAIVGLGALLRASGLMGPADARPLNTVIVYVGLPAFIFRAVHGAPVDGTYLKVVAVAWFVMALCLAIAFGAQRVMRMSRPRGGALMLTAVLGNTGYLGYPLTAALLGTAAVSQAVFYDIFGTVFALVLVGLPLAARFGEHDEAHPSLFKELITFPAVIALLVALATRSVPVPDVVSHGLDLLANLVAPLIMISVGLSLRPRGVLAMASGIAVVVAIKLVAAPLIALVGGGVVLEGEALRVAVLEAGMPSMMLTLVVGERFGLDTEFIASAIFVTTTVSALTVAALQSLAF